MPGRRRPPLAPAWVKALLALAVATLLVGAATTAAAYSPMQPPFGEEWRQEAMDLAQDFGMFGPLDFDGRQLRGAFVEASVEGPGEVLSFKLVRTGTSVEVFARVDVEGATGLGGWDLAGGPPALIFDGPDVSVTIHNNPTRALIYQALSKELEITFVAAPGVFFTPQAGSILVAGPGFTGLIALIGPGIMKVQPGLLTLTLSPGSVATFRAQPGESEGATGPWAQAAVLNSLAKGRLGAELFLVALEGGIMEDVVVYTDIVVNSTLEPEGTVKVFISRGSQEILGLSGTILVLNLHRDVLAIEDLDRLSVDLDGMPVERTSVVDELPATTSPSPLYYAASGPNGIFLMVYIPQLSLRVLTIGEAVESILTELTPMAMAYVLLGVAVVAVAAAVVFRRGREGW